MKIRFLKISLMLCLGAVFMLIACDDEFLEANTTKNTCPNVLPCTTPNPIRSLFARTNTPYGPEGTITNLGVGDLPGDFITLDSAVNPNMKFYHDSVAYPYRPWEFLTFQADSFQAGAVKEYCPCDSALAVLDFTKLLPEEKAQLRDAHAKSEKEGSGNAIIPLPRLNFISNTCFPDGKQKRVPCFPAPVDRDRSQTRTVIAILDTGLDDNYATAFKNDDALATATVGGNFINLEPIFTDNQTDVVRDASDLTDSLGHGTLVTAIADYYAGDHTKYLIYKTHNNKGLGTSFSTACGLICAVKNGADIINMSFGAYTRHSALDSILKEIEHRKLIRAGTVGTWSPPLLVGSKGNAGLNTDTIYHLPSDNPVVHGVSALHWTSLTFVNRETDPPAGLFPMNPPEKHEHWRCSNYSTNQPIFAAPGFVFNFDMQTSVMDTAVGTSFAAPYFSGMAARKNSREDFNVWRDALGSDCNVFNNSQVNYPSLE